MPTYGYRCSRGHHFEVLQRITDAPLVRCPQCESPATRVFYPVGIIFKGQGFYRTDSRGSTGPDSTEPKAEPVKSDSKAAEPGSAKPKSEPPPPAKDDAKSS